MTALTPELEARFVELEVRLEALIALLAGAGETFWRRYLARGLGDVRQRRLTGVTQVLGCYGGEDTFSDLRLGAAETDRRLAHLRTSVFEVANGIAARAATRSR
jgi:hypothetical protein